MSNTHSVFPFKSLSYENHQISAVDMHVENLDSDKMICYPVIQGERINYQNK